MEDVGAEAPMRVTKVGGEGSETEAIAPMETTPVSNEDGSCTKAGTIEGLWAQVKPEASCESLREGGGPHTSKVEEDGPIEEGASVQEGAQGEECGDGKATPAGDSKAKVKEVKPNI